MTGETPILYRTVEDCVEDVIERVGKKIVLGLPLGLGKPNPFVNEMYRRAKEDPDIDLTISTALSLEKPSWSNDLERRFMEPFVERVFGGYIDLDYMLDLRTGKIPSNVTIREFYTKAGSTIGLRHAQQNYISSNYTHACRDIFDSGVNVVAQMVCKDTIDGRTLFSLSCNPDVSLDIAKLMREQERAGAKIAIIAQTMLPDHLYVDRVRQIGRDPDVSTGDEAVFEGAFIFDDPELQEKAKVLLGQVGMNCILLQQGIEGFRGDFLPYPAFVDEFLNVCCCRSFASRSRSSSGAGTRR